MPHSSPMYCKACRHDLRDLPHDNCPECGRWFHPRRACTFSRRPYRLGLPGGRWLIYTLIAFFIVVVLGVTYDIPHLLHGNVREGRDPHASHRSSLQTYRSQLSLYRNQHDETWPTLAQLQDDWLVLTQEIVAENGYTYGPYLQKAPVNPYTDSSQPVAPGEATLADGWAYDERTGWLQMIVSRETATEHRLDENPDDEYCIVGEKNRWWDPFD